MLKRYSGIKLKILVTGGSGFIGSRLASRLAEKGHEVYATVNKNQLQNSNVKIINADFTSDFDIPNVEFDVVYHLAAATPLEKNKKTLKKINYDGTCNFFEKIKDRTRFLVYISGVGVFGDAGKVDEFTRLNPDTEYAKIRLDAQKFLESECKKNDIPITVTYLGEVYGNGGWFTNQILKRLESGKFKIPKGGDYLRSVIHVDDAVESLVAIGEKDLQNEYYILVDANPVLFKDFINFAADELGVKHPGSIPNFVAKAVLGGDAVKLLTTPTQASNAKIAKVIDFKFPSYKEGIKDVISSR